MPEPQLSVTAAQELSLLCRPEAFQAPAVHVHSACVLPRGGSLPYICFGELQVGAQARWRAGVPGDGRPSLARRLLQAQMLSPFPFFASARSVVLVSVAAREFCVCGGLLACARCERFSSRSLRGTSSEGECDADQPGGELRRAFLLPCWVIPSRPPFRRIWGFPP